MKWGAIIPLIGGNAIGSSMAIRKKPSWIMSYPDFITNDSHMLSHWPEVPFYMTEKDAMRVHSDLHGVDFVVATCPCAGLSTANAGNRGANAPQNDWMYISANHILGDVKPRVFWGENAPGLYSDMGKPVAEKLYEIAIKHGYSFSLVKTDTRLHGIPQRRIRTFYFFWDSKTAPTIHWYRRPTKNIVEYLQQIPEWADYQDIIPASDDLKENTVFKWYKKNGLTSEKIRKTGAKTIMQYAVKTNQIDNIRGFAEEGRDDKTVKEMERIEQKLFEGKNYWDKSPIVLSPEESFNAITGRSMKMYIHPIEERYLNLREYMHLMGLPHTFKLNDAKKNWVNITQNVPTHTAKDMATEVMSYIKGGLPKSNAKFLKQDNIKREVEIVESQPSNKLF